MNYKEAHAISFFFRSHVNKSRIFHAAELAILYVGKPKVDV